MAHNSNQRRVQRPREQRPNAAIVIIPDAYRSPQHYELLAASCRALGPEVVVVVQNPSSRSFIGGAGPAATPGLYDDAANARLTIEGLVREGQNVLIVAHSYGAVVASGCVRGLGREELMGVSRGGVVRMLFIAGIVPWEGQNVNEAVEGMLGASTSDNYAGCLTHHGGEKLGGPEYSGAPFEERLTYAGYRRIPVTYMVTVTDRTVPATLQEMFAGVVEIEAGRACGIRSATARR
ncbi:LOW QUALITY PROTEIN: uncharacterized protein ColSpa_09096 [Colletotrichum spaethianum]|uniref:AB hydrolase-1 domain-containing protein n=1 Tax=Colletotrichum spaethianum TaxID=700344 RepID=A0AA37UNQ0_9PEZI|nr:LOW QUALITY PROTEIN: uncharacterized protein ColSpa_09096 [Colletotrichum spaethianum]GKT48915.1 LOW QUALITY PROTEIN: hypothetical protein ColSpa_09096 [Colletotrichum spaethianum]